MADLRLLEFVLLRASFEIRTDFESAADDESSPGRPYPDEDVLALGSSVERQEDEFVLRLDASIDDVRFPFTLSASAGARFLVVDEPELTAERAETTLVFMAFPYLRETIWTLTGRSPYPPYALPPLTRLPDKPVRGDEPLIIKRTLPEDEAEPASEGAGEPTVETAPEISLTDEGAEPPEPTEP